jgi:hypothetical protein
VDTWIWIVIAILLIVLLLRIVGRRAIVGRVDSTDLLLEPELVNQVRALAQMSQKVAAIKLLRERTPGLGLGPAKLMVDRMAASKPAPPASDPAKIDAASGAGPDMMPSALTVPLEVELQVRSLKSSGHTTEAIELVREHTAWDRAAAKSYVDGL